MARPVLAAVAVVAVTAVGCGESAVACGPVEHPELQGGGHLIGDVEPPVPYSSTPGTSGFHAAGAPPEGVFGEDDALNEPQIVRALESGQVVVAYASDRVPDDEVASLEDLASGDLSGRLTVTPFAGDMGAPVTLNAWGTRQPCSSIDEDAVRGFVEEYGGSGPEHG